MDGVIRQHVDNVPRLFSVLTLMIDRRIDYQVVGIYLPHLFGNNNSVVIVLVDLAVPSLAEG